MSASKSAKRPVIFNPDEVIDGMDEPGGDVTSDGNGSSDETATSDAEKDELESETN